MTHKEDMTFFTEGDAKSKIGFMMHHLGLRFQRELNAMLKPYGLTSVHCQLLFGISILTQDERKVNQNELIRFAELNKAMVSTVLKKLSEKGYIKREEDVADLRAKNLFLTEKGRDVLREARPRIERMSEKMFGKYEIDFTPFANALLTMLDYPASVLELLKLENDISKEK